jgi:PPOX class probable F420-dependent enzyme
MGSLQTDGAPLTVATWYLWEDDGRVLLNMDAGRARIEGLRRDPRIALTVLDDNWYRHVSLRGAVDAIEDDPDLVDIDRLSRHYGGNPYPMRDRPRVSARIAVDAWHAWGW